MTEKRTREEALLAYLWDELSAGERAELEAELSRDAALRAELEETRTTLARVHEWMTTPAPGIEKAHNLPVPLLHENLRRLRPRLWMRRLRRVAGIAAIFVFGFALGYVAQTAPIVSPPEIAVVQPKYPPPRPGERELRRVRYARQENGRVVVSLGDSSVWVVDGRFQLAAPSIEGATAERT